MRCVCCGYSGKAKVEYIELLIRLRRRIVNQRNELSLLNRLNRELMAELIRQKLAYESKGNTHQSRGDPP